MAAAAAIMGAAVWALGQWFAKDLSPGDEIRRWSALLGIVGAGGLAYVAVAQILGAADWRELRRLLRRKAD
jgi:peptidoglycan biosynthesis protein MviN/MurJ (putative lipid II flippase)